jgi:hypothetical protein
MNCLASVALALMLLQYIPRRIPPQATPGGANTEAVATFTGTFKSADKKFLTIAVDEGQIMRMYITSATKFIRDGKASKASDFHPDENVSVDASRDARLNLIALRVEATPAPKKPDPKPDQ